MKFFDYVICGAVTIIIAMLLPIAFFIDIIRIIAEKGER